MKGRGFARRVTAETLETLSPLLRKPGAPALENAAESDSDAANRSASASPELQAALEMFRGDSIVVPRPRLASRGAPVRAPSTPMTAPELLADKPRLLWRKALKASDVQSQTGNPTGGIRLTQARFATAAGRIDQTTYFRNDIFGGLTWEVGRPRPYREDAWTEFDITIRGERLGRHRLRVSHKPSGEAGQHNYTTTLHWGDLGETIRSMQLVGALLHLYAPPPGQAEPFSLEII